MNEATLHSCPHSTVYGVQDEDAKTDNAAIENKQDSFWRLRTRAYTRTAVVALFCMGMSFVLFFISLSQSVRTLENEFRDIVMTEVLALNHKAEVLERFLQDIQAFYLSSQFVEEKEFRSFVPTSLLHDTLEFIAWVPNVQSDEKRSLKAYIVSDSAEKEESVREYINSNIQLKSTVSLILRSSDSEATRFAFIPADGDKKGMFVIAAPTFDVNDEGGYGQNVTGVMIMMLDAYAYFSSVFQREPERSIQVYLAGSIKGASRQIFVQDSNFSDKEMVSGLAAFIRLLYPVPPIVTSVPFSYGLLKVVVTPSYSYIAKEIGVAPWFTLLLGFVSTLFASSWFYLQTGRNIAIRKIVEEQTKALSASEQHIRAILENTVDGIITINEQGIVQTYNAACEKIFGYCAEEVVGHDVCMLMPEPFRSAHGTYIQNYLGTGDAKIIGIGRDVYGLRKDGKEFPMGLSIGEVKHNGGHSFVGVVRDITERKEAQHAKEALAAIVEFSDDAMISKDLDGTILSWNRGAERLFGYSTGEVIGKNVSMLIPLERIDEEERILESLRQGKTIEHFETIRVNKAGEYLDISVTISPLRDSQGNVVGASKVARDVTERKRAERRLVEYTEQLKRSNQDLDDFVYIVSHDLKEPLRGLYSYSQFLQEDYADRLEQDGVEKLETLKKLSIRMEELIDTLLYYSRIGRSEMAFKVTDLNKVFKKTTELLESVIQENHAQVTLRGDLPLLACDSVRVGDIFRNLIVNAIKYNDSDPKVIEIGCIDDHKDYPGGHVFFVSDNGIGIDEKHRDVIFKMFKRLHKRDDYGGGTGAGLAFVKKLVDRHGGRIWVEDNESGGSTFYFTLEEVL